MTAKLICVFVFTYAKSRFSHDEAHMGISLLYGIQGLWPKQNHTTKQAYGLSGPGLTRHKGCLFCCVASHLVCDIKAYL